ncbi:MAG: lysophospholipid acyltransferase family protein [Nitrospirae bacterium]|nr:lysophospholipid acyltransferase family protein [Nitrospirota bacterium]
MKRLIEAAEFAAAFLVMALAAVLPRWLIRPFGRAVGRVFLIVSGRRRRIALWNTRLVYGEERPGLVRECFANYGISMIEVARIWLGREDIFSGIEIDGLENYLGAKAAGYPVVFITAHLGNWELLGNALSRAAGGFSVVVRPLDNPFLNRLIDSVRVRNGNRTIPKDGALRAALRVMKGGGTITVLIDQSVNPSEGVVTEFIGRRAYTAKMPAVLALKTGAAVIPMYICRAPKGHRIVLEAPMPVIRTGNTDADIELNTMSHARKIAEFVSAHPDEWLWIHRRWKRFPENEPPG